MEAFQTLFTSNPPPSYTSLLWPLLRAVLPPPALKLLTQTLALYSTHVYPLLYPLRTLLLAALNPLFTTLTRLLASASADDAVAAVGPLLAALVMLYVAFRALDYARRALVALVALALRLLLGAALVAVAAWAWQRGPAQAGADAVALARWVAGMWAGLEHEGERVGRRRADEWEAAGRAAGNARGR